MRVLCGCFKRMFCGLAVLSCMLLLVTTLCPFSLGCHAKTVAELPDKVNCVPGETKLVKDLTLGLEQHKESFYYYYPGIEKDFRRYKKKGYRPFLEKVAERAGYYSGIVSGYCVSICGDSPKYVSIQVCYLTTRNQEKKIDRKVKRIVKRLGGRSRREKIRKAHDYLVRHMQYDKRYYSPYDAFMKGRGMCMAYALAFQRIMQEMEIPCHYIKGKEHAWNEVQIGKYWYRVDVTWDDSSSSYRYFLK